ncbi:hypothetical protein LINGRAHAP2_LOCUS25789 [Linum grandiflorum]
MAASNANAENKMRLKLLVDKKANKVVFAECSNDFVDFLFNLLSLPLSAIITIISRESMVGSVGSIYQSLEDLQQSCFNANRDRNSILTPALPANLPLLLPHPSTGANAQQTRAAANGNGLVRELTSFMVMDDLRVNQLSMISALTLLNKFGCKDLGALDEMEVEFGIDEARKLLKASLESKDVLTNVYLVKKEAVKDVAEEVIISSGSSDGVTIQSI